MSAGSYLWAWVFYLLAALVLLLSCWRVSAGWNRWLRLPLRGLLAALVLVPASVSPAHVELAPAWLVWLFDALMQEDVSGWRAARPLLLFAGLAVVVGLAGAWREQRRDSADPATGEALDG